MRTETGQVFRLEDYRASDWAIPTTRLTFLLDPHATMVRAEIDIRRADGVPEGTQLVLDGDELVIRSIAVDGVPLEASEYAASPERLTLHRPPAAFTLAIETELAPEANSKLMGLYRSSGVFCTQCEAEGFRRITYFLDRPDVLSVYTVRIEAPRDTCPLLLSNGNLVEQGDVGPDRHYAVWHDPHPKPSYLFALVAGDLGAVRDRFTTMSGRVVDLAIFVEHGKEGLATYAMDCLKRSMKWDEEAFGREYDLDVFNVVAVSDFNMGAMENKGLNVFNDKYVLADEATATDGDFANIEAVIAHEYFHNWTGNRITCRDWFQLCLKEGLTVFRDHEFSADQRSRAVKRIAEVRTLRAHQFPEDQGPLAHPVRPRRYSEINNFYTATVYEKGSEVVRMIRTIVGDAAFKAGMDLYFDRHDGQAVTIEDFVKAFEDAAGADLSQFALWYHQSGTPKVSVASSYDQETGTLTLKLEQAAAATPSETRKRPFHIPLAFGLIGSDGEEVTAVPKFDRNVIHLKQQTDQIVFKGLAERPVLSLNRGFSAPITLVMDQSMTDRLFLARHDKDSYGRWQALTGIFTDAIISGVRQVADGVPPTFSRDVSAIAGAVAADEKLDHAFRALALSLPTEADIAREIGTMIDPDAILASREALIAAIAAANRETFAGLYDGLQDGGPFSPDAASAGRRSLRNTLLDLRSADRGGADLALAHFETARNMTDRAAALATLTYRHGETKNARQALKSFERSAENYPLVLDKWLMIQASAPGNETLGAIQALMSHAGFSLANPNRTRALLGTFFGANQTGFHRPDGAAYDLFAQTILDLDPTNPQVAARLATGMRSWRSLEPVRQEKARLALVRIAGHDGLSRDVSDIIQRTLG